MTKEEMFDWLVENKAEILRHPPMKWKYVDTGETFINDFCLRSGETQWPAFATLEEAIEFANAYQACQNGLKSI